MKILSINNSIINSYNTTRKNNCNNRLNMDEVCFTHKKYSIDDINCPTNHCGYCGCKVYTDEQIESIAIEMLESKAVKLQGKIRSVLEKLDGAKYADDIALAKSIENEEEIVFFQNFLETSIQKPFLKGADILRQLYNNDEKENIKLLTIKMRPILRTIDHISPRNRKEDNNNTDINLVEACYCCNHDLKKGVSFNEFYEMFPSIKNNMPDYKFQYAKANLLTHAKEGIIQRLSADNIIKSLTRLFIQREDIKKRLSSIDYRIEQLKSQIEESISLNFEHIKAKKAEISKLEKKLINASSEEAINYNEKINALEAEIHLLEQTICDLKKQTNYHNKNY